MSQLPPIEIDPKTFLHEHCTLPALPAVVTQLQEVISSDNLSIRNVTQLISSDPALVAQVLKIVNSAYYSLPKEIAEVNHAVAYLGIHEVYRVVLSMSVFNTFAIEQRTEFNEIWYHSVYTALCAKYLLKNYEPLLGNEEIWSAAILHDIGKLVYLKFFPDHYKALRLYTKTHHCLFGEAETALALPSSPFVGTLLCDHWRLPSKVRRACESHRLEDLRKITPTNPSEGFNRIICTANLLAILSAEELQQTIKKEIADAVRQSLRCAESAFLVMMGAIYDLRNEVDKFLL